jgi:tetratricopeptide (TPR) repeat protein
MSSRVRFSVVFFLFTVVSALQAAEKPWIEIRSPHFRVLTNGTKSEGRHVAHEFEQMRYVFASRFPNFRLESGAPLLVLAARDELTQRSLEPNLFKGRSAKPAGVYHHGWDKQFVTVRLDTWGTGAHEVVYHEYTHSIIHTNIRWLPLWLDEGIAEFYAYTRFQQHEIYIGAPTERYPWLNSQPLFPIETLITANQQSPYYRDEMKASMFYAESWALVHYMVFGPGMEGGKKLDRFSLMLQQGTEQKKAFLEVFGDFEGADKALQRYLRTFQMKSGVVTDPPQFVDKDFLYRTLTVAETEAELSGFHLWNHNMFEARALAEQAVKDDPKLGLAHEAMGFVDFSEGKDTEALNEFSLASDLDPNLYLSLFAKTMMSPIANSSAADDESAFHEAMLKVLKANPQFAPAYVQLARLYLRQKDLKSALAVSRKAEQLEPSRAGYHLLSGEILRRMDKGPDAAVYARFVAERWPGSDHDEAVELWSAVAPNQRGAGSPLSDAVTKDTQMADGRINEIRCASKDQKFAVTINSDGNSLTFHTAGAFSSGFSDTVWYGEDHFSLCHHVTGMRVVVRYKPSTDTTYAGDIAELEIRDELPAAVQGTELPKKP